MIIRSRGRLPLSRLQAIAYYQMGVDAGDPIALNNLAVYYINREYLENDQMNATNYGVFGLGE